MIKALEEKAYNGIYGGIGIFVVAFLFAFATHLFIPVPGNGIFSVLIDIIGIIAPFLILLCAAVIFGRGCWMYAVAKGHSGMLGLVGLLPFAGWIVLCLLPDNQKSANIKGFPVIQSDDGSNRKRSRVIDQRPSNT